MARSPPTPRQSIRTSWNSLRDEGEAGGESRDLLCLLLAQSGHYGRADPRPLSGVKRTNIDIKGVLDFIDLLPPRLPLWPNLRDDRPANSKAAAPLMRLAMTFPAQHDAIK